MNDILYAKCQKCNHGKYIEITSLCDEFLRFLCAVCGHEVRTNVDREIIANRKIIND